MTETYKSLKERIIPSLERAKIDYKKLEESKVLVIGIGGLGSRVVMNLAKYPIKEIKVLDKGNVGEENVGYQFYPKSMVGKPKVEAIKELVSEFYPWVRIVPIVAEAPDIGWKMIIEELGGMYDFEGRLNKIKEAMNDVDLVIVSTDSLGSRVPVWLLSMSMGKPFIDSGFLDNYGHVFLWLPGYYCTLDYNKPRQDRFLAYRPGYPILPYVADRVSLEASRVAVSYLTGELTRSIFLFIAVQKDMKEKVDLFEWTQGECEHHKDAKVSVMEAINKLLSSNQG